MSANFSIGRSVGAPALATVMERELIGSGASRDLDPLTRKMRRMFFLHERLVTSSDWEELIWHTQEADHLSRAKVAHLRPGLKQRLRRPQHRVNQMLQKASACAAAIARTLEAQLIRLQTQRTESSPGVWHTRAREFELSAHWANLERHLADALQLNAAFPGNYLRERFQRDQLSINKALAESLLNLHAIIVFVDAHLQSDPAGAADAKAAALTQALEHMRWHAREALVQSDRPGNLRLLNRIRTPQDEVNRLLHIALQQTETCLRSLHARLILMETDPV